MRTISYQHFGAYYKIDTVFNNPDDLNDYRNGQPVLYGAPRMHYIKCTDDVYYIRLAKDLDDKLLTIDAKGEFLCDLTLSSADNQALAFAYMMNGDKNGLHPVTQMIISMDEASGMETEDVVTLRGGIMTSEFLGFVPAHVFLVRPELAGSDEIEVEGEIVEIPRFRAGSWYADDNPEFL